MTEQKKTPIAIDGVEHFLEDMTQEEQLLVNHIIDIDHKINSAQFNLDQLTVCKDAFVSRLKTALNTVKE